MSTATVCEHNANKRVCLVYTILLQLCAREVPAGELKINELGIDNFRVTKHYNCMCAISYNIP